MLRAWQQRLRQQLCCRPLQLTSSGGLTAPSAMQLRSL
jgi:hypothetical protein